MDGRSARSAVDSPIDRLIAHFASHDGVLRERARDEIVAEFGSRATAALQQALQSENERVRWEAAKTLSEIGDPGSTSALVTALRDENADVRWIAAEGLVGLGAHAVIPLLQELIMHSGSAWLREGAHHVLHDLSRKHILRRVLRPVLESLDGVAPSIGVMPAAARALRELEEAGYR